MLSFWHWLILGVVLAAAEAVLPGIFLIWLGVAALATGLILLPLQPLLLLSGVPWQAQLALFAVLSVVSVLVGYRIDQKSRKPRSHPFLNRRGHRHIGMELVLIRPIEAGSKGQVSIGNTIWLVAGPETPTGARVRVTEVRGATLMVEPTGHGADG